MNIDTLTWSDIKIYYSKPMVKSIEIGTGLIKINESILTVICLDDADICESYLYSSPEIIELTSFGIRINAIHMYEYTTKLGKKKIKKIKITVAAQF